MEPAATAPTGLTLPPSLPSSYTIHPSDFLAAYPYVRGLLAGAIVFHPSSFSSGPNSNDQTPPRILLVRRAPTDSWPLLWETPGGSVDIPDDASLAATAVRELWEETGLRATAILAAACPSAEDLLAAAGEAKAGGPPTGWTFDEASGLCTFVETGNVWARATVVLACGAGQEVVLRPDEHVEAAWVTENEVRERRIGDGEGKRDLDIISEGLRQTMLKAFALWRETDGWRGVEV